MKITKSRLVQLIKEELHAVSVEEPQAMDMRSLLGDLSNLLKNWPACEEQPNSMACRYHKDLEKVILGYGGVGCGPGAHKVGAEDQDEYALKET